LTKYINKNSTITTGLIIYNNSELTIKTYASNPGGFTLLIDGVTKYVITFDSSGNVNSVVDCSTLPSITPTNTPTNTPSNTRTPSATPPSTPTNTPSNTRTPAPLGYNCPCESPVSGGVYSTQELCLSVCFPSYTPTNTPTPSPAAGNTKYNAVLQQCNGFGQCADNGGTVVIDSPVALSPSTYYSEGGSSSTVYYVIGVAKSGTSTYTFINPQSVSSGYCCL
jgi:hypothetical protein